MRFYFLVPPISIDWRPRREFSVTYVRELRKGEIPPRLTPRDFDWVQSRIRKSGRWEKVRGPFGSFVGQWEVIDAARHTPDKPVPESHRRRPSGDRVMAYWHRVELGRADVTELFNLPEADPGQHKPQRQQPRSKSRPATERARRIINELYPGGVPDQATETNAQLCRHVGAGLKKANLLPVSDDSILRAAGRRK